MAVPMIDHILRAAAVNREYAKMLVADIPDDKMCVQPAPGMNHATWCLGHIAFVFDSMIRVLDQKPSMPREWIELFSNVSTPTSDASRYPSKAAILEFFEKAFDRMVEAIKATPAEVFEREFPNPKLRPMLPTVGVAMVHVLTTHAGVHLGQLSAWRRVQGMPGVM